VALRTLRLEKIRWGTSAKEEAKKKKEPAKETEVNV